MGRVLARCLCMVVAAAAAGACRERLEPPPVRQTVAAESAESVTVEDAPLVVFLGDSVTAGFGLEKSQAFPTLVDELLRREDLAVRVVNAGLSGDTSTGGLRRLEWLLKQAPDVVVVELGANDGLRGLPLELTEQNLRETLLRIREAGARVLLLGMRLPPNYGPEYAASFAALFPRLARELDVALVPFALEGVGGDPDLNLADGIHPNAEGHRRVAQNVIPYLREILQEVEEEDGF
jgi:acyl-CoA thioesterase-1